MTFNQFVEKVKTFEGFVGSVYTDPSGVRTIGYGFTSSCFPLGKMPDKLTEEEADTILLKKLNTTYTFVYKYMTQSGYHVNDDILFALTDFTYNCGSGNLLQLTDHGKRTIDVIAEKIVLYNKGGGKVLNGLVKRRAWEQDLILQGIEKLDNSYTIKRVQSMCNTMFDKNLVVDGICGEKTCKAIIDIFLSL